MSRVQPAVTISGSRFKPGPHEYVVRPPYGDGTTRYQTRQAALDAYDTARKERDEQLRILDPS